MFGVLRVDCQAGLARSAYMPEGRECPWRFLSLIIVRRRYATNRNAWIWVYFMGRNCFGKHTLQSLN